MLKIPTPALRESFNGLTLPGITMAKNFGEKNFIQKISGQQTIGSWLGMSIKSTVQVTGTLLNGAGKNMI